MAELGPFVLAHRMFKINLYRKIWNTVQRHWTAERWIRVNPNQKLAEFIQLNGVDLDQMGRPSSSTRWARSTSTSRSTRARTLRRPWKRPTTCSRAIRPAPSRRRS
jgi:hypothetical protein